MQDRDVLSDIVKRGSYRACEHEKSCASVHVLPQQLAAADILLRRWSVLFRKKHHLAARLSSVGLPGSAVGAILRSKAGLSEIRLRTGDLSRVQGELTND